MRPWAWRGACAAWALSAALVLLPGLTATPASAHQITPETAEPGALDLRLAAKGMTAGEPVMIRIFKGESELELWMRKDGRFGLLAVYPICKWSGSLGPKITEGDRQSPEGFYSIGVRQLHKKGRWPRSLDIGYPNTFDRAHERTGSYILVHGGCTTTGCYAMTNQVMEEIYALSEAALKGGQDRIPVHVFPFRMTQENLAARAESEWGSFWMSLKRGYDLFERTRVPPQVAICEKQYVVTETGAVLPDGCVDNVSEVQPPVAQAARVLRAAKRVRRAAARRSRARAAPRNTRKAYAAARTKRMLRRPQHATAQARQTRYD
jgi:murein L,D-transpeptidase YafK